MHHHRGLRDLPITSDLKIKERVDDIWEVITAEFAAVYAQMNPTMEREELSFHDNVKLLGYLSFDVQHLVGDVLEIGVWKGKSLSLLDKCNPRETQIIGIDPCEIAGQTEELTHFVTQLIPRAKVLVQYSERCLSDFLDLTRALKLLHIDGGHLFHNVWLDFLLYSPFVVSGGYVVFDDFADHKHCPEVGQAVNALLRKGLFQDYEIVGVVKGFETSFVIRRK